MYSPNSIVNLFFKKVYIRNTYHHHQVLPIQQRKDHTSSVWYSCQWFYNQLLFCLMHRTHHVYHLFFCVIKHCCHLYTNTMLRTMLFILLSKRLANGRSFFPGSASIISSTRFWSSWLPLHQQEDQNSPHSLIQLRFHPAERGIHRPSEIAGLPSFLILHRIQNDFCSWLQSASFKL